MNFDKSASKRALTYGRWLLLPVLLAVLAMLFAVNPTDHEWVPKCMVKQLTGFDCPGCGLQRAVHAALHGRWAEAWAYNRFLIYSLPYLLGVAAAEWFTWGRVQQRLRSVLESPRALLLYVVLYMIWGIVRNVIGC